MKATRRTFVGGLAACLAAGSAPFAARAGFAARHGLGLRLASLGGKGRPSARDYVQDGLFAMWDGIENAGLGRHDPNARVWKDLAGANDVSLPATSFFGDDHLDHKTNLNWPKVSANALTIEIIVAAYDENLEGNPRFFAAPSDPRFELDTQNGTRVNLSYVSQDGVFQNRRIYADLDVKNTNAFSVVLEHGKIPILFANNISHTTTGDTRIISDVTLNATTFSVHGGRGSQMHGRIFSFRQYAKALTAAEIAANFAVDVSRFGLAT